MTGSKVKVGNPVIFNSYLLHHFLRELATDNGFLNYSTIYKFYSARFLIFIIVSFDHMTLNFAQTSVTKSRLSVPYGANLFDEALPESRRGPFIVVYHRYIRL